MPIFRLNYNFLNWNTNFQIQNNNLEFKYQFLDSIIIFELKYLFSDSKILFRIQISIFRSNKFFEFKKKISELQCQFSDSNSNIQNSNVHV